MEGRVIDPRTGQTTGYFRPPGTPPPTTTQEAERVAREQVQRSGGRGIVTPVTSGSSAPAGQTGTLTAEQILQLIQQPTQTPDISEIVRQVREALDIARPPQIDFARALSTVQSSLAPYAESAQRQLQEEGARALRALQAQQAMAGIAGSPAQRAIQQLTEAQAQAASDLAARLQTAAAEQALNLIAAQTDRFRTQAAAEAAAQQLAQNIFSELAATQRAQQAGLLNALLGLYQTQASERQAMLPYTAVPLASLLPYAQPTQQDILQFILELLGQTGGSLAGLGLY